MQYKASEVVSRAKNILDRAGITHYNDTVFLLEKVLDRKCGLLQDIILSEDQYTEYVSLINRRSAHEPLDSLIGYTEFLGLNIPYHRETLSPRQETEIMVDNIIKENSDIPNLKILDLCTGSGCIGIALAKYLRADVTLADISDEALSVASENARLNNTNVKLVQGNLFENISDQFDIIVTNPPYIPSKDIVGLEQEVLEFDPLLALDGGHDGLDLVRQIISNSPSYLKEGGLIYIEYGIGQTQDIVNLMTTDFDSIEVVKDYSGIERYIKARKMYVKQN